MGDSYYPLPHPGYTFGKLNVPPRDLLPIYPPPEPLALPALPSPSRSKPSFDAPYRLTTHLVPSAYLRTSWDPPVPAMPDVETKEERIKWLEKTYQIIRDNCTSFGMIDGHPRLLWNCLNRYVRQGLDQSSSTGITLFFAHATGFPKELWEPTIGHLLSSQDVACMVDEIWAWEAVQHGDAGLVNASSLSGAIDWTDNTRDIVNFLINFMPTSPKSDAPLPTHLPRISSEEAEARLQHGFNDRRQIVVVGHSFGGCTSALAACIFPALFTSLILVDPVIVEPGDIGQLTKSDRLAYDALGRREKWPSKTEVMKSFQNHPFFNSWDRTALDLYIQHAIHDTTDPVTGQPVARLKMTAMQECICYASDRLTPRETFERLQTLDERIRLKWVVPGKAGREDSVGGTGQTERRVWVRTRNASNVKIKEAGHLIPMEAPKELAREIRQHLFGIFGHRSPLKSNL